MKANGIHKELIERIQQDLRKLESVVEKEIVEHEGKRDIAWAAKRLLEGKKVRKTWLDADWRYELAGIDGGDGILFVSDRETGEALISRQDLNDDPWELFTEPAQEPETFGWEEALKRMRENADKFYTRGDGETFLWMKMDLSGMLRNVDGQTAAVCDADFTATDWREVGETMNNGEAQ